MQGKKLKWYAAIFAGIGGVLLVVMLPIVPLRECQLFAAGDTMLARWMHQEAYKGTVSEMFGNVLPHLYNSDAAFVNLECVLSDRGSVVEKGESRPFPYRARPEMVRFLKEAGIDIVSQANNHAGDYGPDALEDSLAILTSQGIHAVGAGRDAHEARAPQYVTIRGVTTAWIAFDMTEPDFRASDTLPGTFYVSEPEAVNALRPIIQQARRRADLVFLTPHWGKNWEKSPTQELRRLAYALIDCGADAILGHSSHLVQGMEIHNGHAIIYDMGSFLFDSVSDSRLTQSMIFKINLSKRGIVEIVGRPITLRYRSVRLSKGREAKETLNEFIKRSMSLNREFDYALRPDRVVIPVRADYRNGSLWSLISRKKSEARMAGPVTFDFDRVPDSMKEAIPTEPTIPPAVFENGMKLLGCKLPANVPQEMSFGIELYFQALRDIALPPCEIGVYLYRQNQDSGSVPVSNGGHEPGDWGAPTSRWRKGDRVLDRFLFRPPRLELGLYDVFVKVISMSQPTVEIPSVSQIQGGADPRGVYVGQLEIVSRQVSDKIQGLAMYGR